jgi:hypothetical protein
VPSWDHLPKAPKGKNRERWLPQRHTGKRLEDRVFSLRRRCASGEWEQDVVRYRAFGSCLSGNSAPWMPEIQKASEDIEKSYTTLITVMMKVKPFLDCTQASMDFLLSSDLAVEGM